MSNIDEGVAPTPMFPLGTVLFPGEVLPLHVFEPRYRSMTATVLDGDRTFGVILIARGSEVGGGDERVSVGTLGRIVEAAEFPDGRYALLVRGERRLRVREWLLDDPYPLADTVLLESGGESDDGESVARVTASVRRARALLSELGATLGQWDGSVAGVSLDDLSWKLASLAPLGTFDQQSVLEINDPIERLRAIERLSNEVADDATRMLSESTPDDEGHE